MTKEDYVYRVFEHVASGYDTANDRISLGRHKLWKRSAVKRLLASVPTGGRILDLCCGTGDIAQLIFEIRPDVHVTGLDFSPAMLAQAQIRFVGRTTLSLVHGNAMALPFESSSFDGAIISFALRNTANYKRVLTEMARVIKDGSPACCIDSFTPTSPVVRPFYKIYFFLLMPLLGGGKSKRQEYRWLCRSTKEYISPDELRRMMAECGLTDAEIDRFMFGSCVSICTYKEGTHK